MGRGHDAVAPNVFLRVLRLLGGIDFGSGWGGVDLPAVGGSAANAEVDRMVSARNASIVEFMQFSTG
jgi:hypothetical protein